MAQDKETRELLIKSAKAEFMEKGYNKASLRSICSDAGVTTTHLLHLCLNMQMKALNYTTNAVK